MHSPRKDHLGDYRRFHTFLLSGEDRDVTSGASHESLQDNEPAFGRNTTERLQMHLGGSLTPLLLQPPCPPGVHVKLFILKVNRERPFENIAFP